MGVSLFLEQVEDEANVDRRRPKSDAPLSLNIESS
jgi:hypothetical protein